MELYHLLVLYHQHLVDVDCHWKQQQQQLQRRNPLHLNFVGEAVVVGLHLVEKSDVVETEAGLNGG